MTPDPTLVSALCQAINTVKRSAHDPARVDLDQYLGGDLGIDSIEMLEIWFHAEKLLGIRLPDDAKRDVYTLGEAVAVLARHGQPQGTEVAHV